MQDAMHTSSRASDGREPADGTTIADNALPLRAGAPPTISAVIPAYNAEGFVARAIDSVLSQTHPVHEVLVVDDGSRDGTARIVESFGPSVRPIRQENSGPGAARNHGAREARGEWIALLDADDAWLPRKIERQLPYLADASIAVVHSDVVDVEGQYTRYLYDGELNFDRLWRQNLIGTSTALVRKAAWSEIGGFDIDRDLISIEDYNFWLRMLAAGWRIVRCPEPLSEYTPAPQNLSSQMTRVMRAELLNATKIARIARLSSRELQTKQAAIYAECGFARFHAREMASARESLGMALQRRATLPVLTRWLATFAPSRLVDCVHILSSFALPAVAAKRS